MTIYSLKIKRIRYSLKARRDNLETLHFSYQIVEVRLSLIFLCYNFPLLISQIVEVIYCCFLYDCSISIIHQSAKKFKVFLEFYESGIGCIPATQPVERQ